MKITSISRASFGKLALTVVLFFAIPIYVNAQTVIKRYVCGSPLIKYSSFIYDDILTESSNCGSGTEVRILENSNPGLASAEVVALDNDRGQRRAQLNLTWHGTSGVVIIKIQYRKRYRSAIPVKCQYTSWRNLYTYEIHRGNPSPGNILEGKNVASISSSSGIAEFTLKYKPASSIVTSGLKITKIKYNNGKDVNNDNVEDETIENINSLFGFYVSTTLEYYASDGEGTYTVNAQVYSEAEGSCGWWTSLPAKVLVVNLSCYQDDFSAVSITPVGTGAVFHPEDNSYTVQKDQTYELDVEGITDFEGHFHWVTDGGEDVTLTGNTFTVNSDLGSYRIELVSNDDGCDSPEPLQVLTGGSNTFIEEPCSITLPEYMATVINPETDEPYDLEVDDIVFKHFTTNVKSKRSIIVKPGVSLELGAELIIEDDSDVPATDITLNFTEKTSYDEYGRTLAVSRSYFDDKGDLLQTQYKNLTNEVILANAVLYDVQGRAAISTLPAPIQAAEPAECPLDDQTGSGVDFSYKEDFVIAEDDEVYNATHFDLTNEDTPVALSPENEGTLGWYYSTNNGTSENPKMNEPLVATTQYPYSRTLFLKDGSGEVKGVTKPGDIFKAGSDYLATADQKPVASDDKYFNTDVDSYLSIREKELGLARPASITGQFFKTIFIDESGKTSVSYTDISGNTIIGLYFGNSCPVITNACVPIIRTYQFYDDAGRLLLVISPNGLNQYEVDSEDVSNFDDIDKTRHFYNSKGFLVAAEEKIAGQNSSGISRTEFVYRKDGQIRFSQNEEQREATPERYSYTNYDNSGRPIESGEYEVGVSNITFNSTAMKNILENTGNDGGLPEDSGVKRERTFSYYDEPDPAVPLGRSQRFIQGSISYTKKDNSSKTWYSYDERGRVEWMIQDIAGFGIKTVDYRFGPAGQVQDIVYQKGNPDEQFTHFYEYDPDGRLSKTYTTRELLVYDKFGKLTNTGITYNGKGEIDNPGALEHQVTYHYYLHGPLKRVELATRKEGENYITLQGIDYTYTADGTLKGINHADPANDPAGDGTTNVNVKPDVFGMTLEYYPDDYVGAGYDAGNVTLSGIDDQYTGLIKASRWHSPVEPDKQFAYAYHYNSRNQFTKADWGTVTGALYTLSPLKPYHEEIGDYDHNGNIESLQRNANILSSVEYFNYDLSYNYKENTNILESITQTQGEDTETFREYSYNNLGQMTEETGEDESKFVVYDVTGKVTAVYADAAHEEPVITFTYDERGFRLSKTMYSETFEAALTTWYVRDVIGNILSTYEQDLILEASPQITEVPIYGRAKIGLYKPDFGMTLYELTDHLGNVRAVIGEGLEAEYLATMESERNVKELQNFENVIPSATSSAINHTPGVIVVDDETTAISNPNEVTRLNNVPAGVPDPNPIGPGIMLWVHPGDVISTSVYAKYASFDDEDTDIMAGISGFLTTVFSPVPEVDGASIFNVMNSPDFAALPAWSKLNENRPRAFLNYLLFDNDLKLQEDGFDFDQVTDEAALPGAGNNEEQLSLEVTVQKEGFIYIYVSNESDQNMDVYFDDFYVKHTYSNIVAGGDYYPYGLSIKDRQISREKYRFGYQGQFSEKDDETGWNHFQLREYDPVIGRWTAVDSKRQFFSPYVGMGNNSINGVDPNGADWYRHDASGATIWRDGSASLIEVQDQLYRNIGTTYAYSKYGMAFKYDQNTLVSLEELTRFDVDNGVQLPSTFYLSSGRMITVDFGNSADGVSSSRFLKPDLVKAFIAVMEEVGDENNINCVWVSATTNGKHTAKSNHYVGNRGAIDISRINGVYMETMPTNGVILDIQNAIEELPNRRENFGPAFNRKLGNRILPYNQDNIDIINNHKNHVHFSVN